MHEGRTKLEHYKPIKVYANCKKDIKVSQMHKDPGLHKAYLI